MTLREGIQHVALFQSLPSDALDALAAMASSRVVRAGETVFCQGEPSPYAFGILRGQVRIERAAANGAKHVLAHIGPGSFFGESALLSEGRRLATASAEQDGELLVLPGARLRAWLLQAPPPGVEILLALLREAHERFRHGLEILESAARDLR